MGEIRAEWRIDSTGNASFVAVSHIQISVSSELGLKWVASSAHAFASSCLRDRLGKWALNTKDCRLSGYAVHASAITLLA